MIRLIYHSHALVKRSISAELHKGDIKTAKRRTGWYTGAVFDRVIQGWFAHGATVCLQAGGTILPQYLR